MRRLLPLLASTVLVAGITPAFAAPSTSTDVASAPSTDVASAPSTDVASAPSTDVASAPAVDAYLLDKLATTPATETFVVAVRADDVATAEAAALSAGLVPITSFRLVGTAIAAGTPAQVRAVMTTEGVTYVEADRPAEYHLQTSHAATRYDVARATLTTPSGAAIDGTGVSIAIVDSGIDGTHPGFRRPGAPATNPGLDASTSKVVKNVKDTCPFLNPVDPAGPGSFNTLCFQDVVGNDSDTPSAGGHGTHVAGIAGLYDVTTTDGRKLSGAAPGADLVGISVGASLSVYGGAAGLNWVLENHADPCGDGTCPPIKVVNNSYGPVGGGEFNPTAVTSIIQDKLVAAGVVVVWAAGNDGGDGSANTTNPSGASPTPGILSVANYDDGNSGTRNGALAASSSRGQKGRVASYPDISAPGSNITSACRPTLSVCATGFDTADPDYNTISGTSMAAPHIAGYVADLFQADPTLTPADIERILEDTAYRFTAGGAYEADTRNAGSPTSFDKGHGLVDMGKAIATVLGADDPIAVEQCTTGNGRFTDDAGDATGAIIDTPLPSEPSLDIVEAFLTSAPSATVADRFDVTFNVRVSDLPETPGGNTSGQGEYFDFNFSYGGAGYYISMRRNATASSFALGHFETARVTDATLTGTFDPATDTVSAVLPASVIPFFAIAAGDTFAGLQVVARRQLVAIVPDADTADGSCPFTVGGDVIDPANTAPTAAFTFAPGSPETGEELTFDASTSTDAETATADLTYAWDFGDGTTGVGQVVTHAYAVAGDHDVTLTVTDAGGLADSATTTVTVTDPAVENAAPTAVASATVTSTPDASRACKDKDKGGKGKGGKPVKDCPAGGDVAFDGTGSSDPDGDALSYGWDFGDGTSGTGATVDHTYTADGTYSVTLTVDDGQGGTGTDTIEVVIGSATAAASGTPATNGALALLLLAAGALVATRRGSRAIVGRS